ncbi:Uncharacterised protein [Porphyromonas crevioricanis]|uniref:Uncharacterized protein n=1 Tax=Porphyromonas crevioricanis TaxID=393921 RepID=A0A2X4PGH8_9PORP|nr:Uncharacterised protein [Porphyromonas crevioricanis]
MEDKTMEYMTQLWRAMAIVNSQSNCQEKKQRLNSYKKFQKFKRENNRYPMFSEIVQVLKEESKQ